MRFTEGGYVDQAHRRHVARLRDEFRTTFADHIARVIADAPDFTPGQLARMRRVFQARSHR